MCVGHYTVRQQFNNVTDGGSPGKSRKERSNPFLICLHVADFVIVHVESDTDPAGYNLYQVVSCQGTESTISSPNLNQADQGEVVIPRPTAPRACSDAGVSAALVVANAGLKSQHSLHKQVRKLLSIIAHVLRHRNGVHLNEDAGHCGPPSSRDNCGKLRFGQVRGGDVANIDQFPRSLDKDHLVVGHPKVSS